VTWAAAAPAVAHVLVDRPLDDDLVVDGRDGHHLQRVRRLGAGECVTAGDGRGAWRLYRVASAGRGRLELRADSEASIEPALAPPLAVAFALTKGQKPESVVARLTELGVDRIVPFSARRSVVRWKDARTEPALERLRRVAREAAMQCRRARLPEVGAPARLDELARHPGLVLADREGEGPEAVPDPGPDGWLLLVGPEGGLDPAERQDLDGAPRLGLGPHVLRSETAAVAAAAALTVRRRAQGGHAG